MSFLYKFDVDYLVALDFETYYDIDYSLKKMTTEAYVRDPRFEAIGVGIKVERSPADRAVDIGDTFWLEIPAFLAWTRRFDWSRAACLAHHAHFDGLICSHHFGIIPKFWFDTLSMSRALHPPIEVGGSLDALMRYYEVGEKGFEVANAIGKRRRDFTLEEFTRYGEYCKGDVDGTRAIFWKMVYNGFPGGDLEFRSIDTTIRAFTEPKFVLNRPRLEMYLIEERKRKADLLARVGADKTVLRSNDKFATLLTSLGEDPPLKVSLRTGENAFAFARTDPGFQALLEHERDDIRWLAEARLSVMSNINETRTERLLSADSRGPVPIYLSYHKAHTGRWAGGDKLNPQNFERVDKKNPNKGVIRASLLAPEGFDVLVVDSAQIEARKIAWLAEFFALLQDFAQNVDVYSKFATRAYGRPIDRKRELPDGTQPDFIPGFVGKVCVLGLGYGMGWQKFAATMLQGALGGPPVVFGPAELESLDVDVANFLSYRDNAARVEAMPSRLPLPARQIHCAVANEFVKRYRAENRPIVDLWAKMGFLLESMTLGVENVFGPGGCLRTSRHAVRLPSGRVLRYPGLEQGDDGFSYMGGRGGKERVRIYGGAMTENTVQALARDVIAYQIDRVKREFGLHVLTSTHDEGVFLSRASESEATLEKVLDIFKTAPAWAPGLPLSAEGGFARSYGAAK